MALGLLSLKSDGNWLMRKVMGWGLAESGWDGVTFTSLGNGSQRGTIPPTQSRGMIALMIAQLHPQLSRQPR